MAVQRIQLPAELRNLMRSCATRCINGCCDPIEFSPSVLSAWMWSLGRPGERDDALLQVERIATELETMDTERVAFSDVQCEGSREEVLELLLELRKSLEEVFGNLFPEERYPRPGPY